MNRKLSSSVVATSLLGVAIAASAGCGASDEAQPPRADPSPPSTLDVRQQTTTRGRRAARTPFDGSWLLVSGRGPSGAIALPARSSITIVIDRGEASGTAACNSYRASVQVARKRFSVNLVSTTVMACEPELMAADTAYHAALQAVDAARRRRDGLILTGDSTELRFARMR